MDLIATPGNPAPPGAIVTPVLAQDGVVLRVARWPVANAPRGTVCVFTGRGEFIEKYFETISEMHRRGFTVVAMDWRGQGLSGRALADLNKGHIDDFALYERDIAALDQQVLRFLCPPPFFALAHSMGGAIVLAQAQARRSPFARLVLSAPMVDLHRLPVSPKLVRGMIEFADIVGLGGFYIPGGKPRSAMLQPFEGNVLTSDRGRYARNAAIVAAAPQLAIGDPTIGWLHAAFRLMRVFADPYAQQPDVPVLAFAAGEDRVVSSPAIERYVGGLRTGLVIPLPKARHEILQEAETIRDQFWAAFDAFVPGETGGAGVTDGAKNAGGKPAQGLRELLGRLGGRSAAAASPTALRSAPR